MGPVSYAPSTLPAMSTMKDGHQWIGTKTEPQANALAEMLSVIFNWCIKQKLQKHNPAQFKKDELCEKKGRQ